MTATTASTLEPSRTQPHLQPLLGSGRQVLRDITRGFFIITHNGFALVGIAAMLLATVLFTQPDLRSKAATHTVAWLQSHQLVKPAAASTLDPATLAAANEASPASDPTRVLATDPDALPRQQAAVAYWISRKYRVAPEPVGLLVKEAYAIGQQEKIDPALLLAVMAIESSFNPFAQSHVGAQGLMQVMTEIHSDKYDSYGGNLSAFDPVTNLRVGAKVLKETIGKAGSLRGGLKYYVGAANLPTDQGYGDKVLAEYARLRAVSSGRTVASDAVLPIPDEANTRVAAASAANGKSTSPKMAGMAAGAAKPAKPLEAPAQDTAAPLAAEMPQADTAPAAQKVALANING